MNECPTCESWSRRAIESSWIVQRFTKDLSWTVRSARVLNRASALEAVLYENYNVNPSLKQLMSWSSQIFIERLWPSDHDAWDGQRVCFFVAPSYFLNDQILGLLYARCEYRRLLLSLCVAKCNWLVFVLIGFVLWYCIGQCTVLAMRPFLFLSLRISCLTGLQ